MSSATEDVKKKLVLSMIGFLKLEAINSNPDKKESIEVAVQCLESAFAVDGDAGDKPDDLVSIFLARLSPNKEEILSAEMYKCKGNDCMRAESYSQAIEHYTQAIKYNPQNAVYYCNRAAAYSRLGEYDQAISDCHAAVDIDPNYAKAYGRLGIAYSSLHKFILARDAYSKALNLDPGNTTYEANLKIAEERINARVDQVMNIGIQLENAANNPQNPVGISQFINNPTLMNMASQMLSVPGIRDVMTGILEVGTQGSGTTPDVTVLMQMGQQLAQQMQADEPELMDSIRREFLAGEAPDLAEAASELGAHKKDNPKPPGPHGDAPT